MAECSRTESTKQENGRERVLSLFKWRYGDPLSEQGKEWVTTVLAASVFGFIFAGYIGAKRSGEKYIVMNHNTKYPHAMQAQREYHSAQTLGFVGNGLRLGWRIALFAAVFGGTKIVVSTYRNKEGGLNYIAAGAAAISLVLLASLFDCFYMPIAAAGCLYRVNLGLKPAIGGMVLGTLMSIPIGFFMFGIHGLDHFLSRKIYGSEVKEGGNNARDRQERTDEMSTNSTSSTQQQKNNVIHNSTDR